MLISPTRFTAAEDHDISARGVWDDFKASVKNAGQKVKNAFGKKQEEARQFFGVRLLYGAYGALGLWVFWDIWGLRVMGV